MKRYQRYLATLAFLLLASILLTACDPLPPVIDERCIDYEDYSFYQIEKDSAFGSTDQWILETPNGKLEINDNIYEGAMNFEYSEICYERTDTVATQYLYTKKSASIRPEPEVITETVEVEVIVEVPGPTVYTHTILEDIHPTFTNEAPVYLEVRDGVGWVMYNVTNDNRAGITTEYDAETNPIYTNWELENFLEGDMIIITIVFEPHTITADMVWVAQITHYRYGILINTVEYPELFVIAGANKLEEYATNWIIENPMTEVYLKLYPEIQEEE